jgi:hypothetical protein
MKPTTYTDPEMEKERALGYNDGLSGWNKGRPGLKWISAYTTGWSEGSEIRDKTEADRKERAKRERLAKLQARRKA